MPYSAYIKSYWINDWVTVITGVTLGAWAVKAEGAVVSKDVEAYKVVRAVSVNLIKQIQNHNHNMS